MAIAIVMRHRRLSFALPPRTASRVRVCPARRLSDQTSSDSSPTLQPASPRPCDPISSEYASRVRNGAIRRDAAQESLARRLDALRAELASTDSRVPESREVRVPPEEGGLWDDGGLFPVRRRPPFRGAPPSGAVFSVDPIRRALDRAVREVRNRAASALGPPTPRGLYVHGSVGSGKSYLMDMFHDSCSTDGAVASRRGSRRAHFHEFMLDVHGRVHDFKRSRPRCDPIPPVAESLAREARLLCFDEFQVSDIADAMIVRRLFTKLFDAGVVVVATSNRAPEELYEGGLNRQLFLPFVDTLKGACDVVEMGSEVDYRRLGAASGKDVSQTYFWPSNDAATAERLKHIFSSAGSDNDSDGCEQPQPRTIPVMMGRSVHVARSNSFAGWFDFRELCHRPLGAADYLAIARRFPVVIVENVPRLGAQLHNEARRFVTLVDVLYEARTRLILSAEVPLSELFVGFEADVVTNDGDEEVAVAGLDDGKQVVEAVYVDGKGGSSSSHSTTMLRTKDGEDVEWSATGRVGVSLAQLSAVRDVAFSFLRAESRLAEMSRESWGT